MKLLPLKHGLVAQVDDDVYEWAARFTWCIGMGRPGKKYIYRIENGRTILLHREVMGNPKGKLVDHRFADTLDCRRESLRIASPAQNAANRRPGASGLKGVVYRPRFKQWHAIIRHKKKDYVIGRFDSMKAATSAYDRVARRLHGEFAYTNHCPDEIKVARELADLSRKALAAALRRNRKWKGLPPEEPRSSHTTLANLVPAPPPEYFPANTPIRTLRNETEWRICLHADLKRVRGKRGPTRLKSIPRVAKYPPAKIATALGISLANVQRRMAAGEFGGLENVGTATKPSYRITKAGYELFQAKRHLEVASESASGNVRQ